MSVHMTSPSYKITQTAKHDKLQRNMIIVLRKHSMFKWHIMHLCSNSLFLKVLRKTGHAAFTLFTDIHNYSAFYADSALLLYSLGRNLIPSPETT
jgi:hypothetical protein